MTRFVLRFPSALFYLVLTLFVILRLMLRDIGAALYEAGVRFVQLPTAVFEVFYQADDDDEAVDRLSGRCVCGYCWQKKDRERKT